MKLRDRSRSALHICSAIFFSLMATGAYPAAAQADGGDASPNASRTATVAGKSPKPLRLQPGNGDSTTARQIRIESKSVSAPLQQGYEALLRGDLMTARAAYATALRDAPTNADALTALALIDWREGRNASAEAALQKAAASAPRSAGTLAAQAMLHPAADPLAMESRLKNALTDQPDEPTLHFALGNAYARQLRWADAHQAYFRAVTGDPDNPDYLFNLAVSLEHLNQIRLAQSHYRQALIAAGLRPASFDRAQAQARVEQLESGSKGDAR